MRLIDADIIKKQFDPNTWQGEMMIAIVDGLPTVYDVDKVVEKIKTDDSVKCFGSVNSGNLLIQVSKAVEIVKGGVE